MLANSEFVALLKQANTDSSKMAEVIGVSDAQLRFVTNGQSGMGLLKCGNVVIPFDNQISKDTSLYKLYNTNLHEIIQEQKAKANITPTIGELIQIASEKAQYPDYNNKHGAKAQFGWYRYNTRFGIPVYDEDGNLERYNIFSTRMLVRCDADGKLYLYDLVRTKKETSKPHEQ